jgi:hypothetical protein
MKGNNANQPIRIKKGEHSRKKILECFSNGGGAAAIQVGKSALTLPYCCKLGLGVQDINIAVGTGADLITSSAGRGTN